MQKSLLLAALAGLTASTANAQAHDPAPKKDQERCYGIAAKGQNDCASADGKHFCAGMAESDNHPAEWRYVKKGECAKSGGNVKPPKA